MGWGCDRQAQVQQEHSFPEEDWGPYRAYLLQTGRSPQPWAAQLVLSLGHQTLSILSKKDKKERRQFTFSETREQLNPKAQ